MNPKYVPVALLASTIALGVGAQFAGLPGAFLVGAALALSLVIGLIWASLHHLSGDSAMSFEDALSLAAPTAAEEQKRAVLRALKDLEYELSVGKISAEDFAQVSADYRQRAKQLIAVADESLAEGRKRALAELERELKKRPANPEASP